MEETTVPGGRIRELAKPKRGSWGEFRRHWRHLVYGTFLYVLGNLMTFDLRCISVVWARLRFALLKRGLDYPLRTPEGMVLLTSAELLVYYATYVEGNLYDYAMHRDLEEAFEPVIIDVGFNCGMVTAWLSEMNHGATFYGIEVLKQNIQRAESLHSEMARPPKIGGIFHNAAWNVTEDDLQIYHCDQVTAIPKGKVSDFFTVKTLAIDDIPWIRCDDIFLIKIDTDGSNYQVLQGAKETLKRTKWLLLEDEAGVDLWLDENPDWFSKKLTHCDLLCWKRPHS